MEFRIDPKTSVGPIYFGSTRDQVRKILQSPFQEFKKTPKSKIPTDAFDQLGVHVYYDSQLQCEAVELFSESKPMFQGMSLFEMNANEAALWLKKMDPKLEIEDVSATSYKFGISLYVGEGLDQGNSTIDSILAFKDGYYD
jgi:hypothetical protein